MLFNFVTECLGFSFAIKLEVQARQKQRFCEFNTNSTYINSVYWNLFTIPEHQLEIENVYPSDMEDFIDVPMPSEILKLLSCDQKTLHQCIT